jgi:hypothetical protein
MTRTEGEQLLIEKAERYQAMWRLIKSKKYKGSRLDLLDLEIEVISAAQKLPPRRPKKVSHA